MNSISFGLISEINVYINDNLKAIPITTDILVERPATAIGISIKVSPISYLHFGGQVFTTLSIKVAVCQLESNDKRIIGRFVSHALIVTDYG